MRREQALGWKVVRVRPPGQAVLGGEFACRKGLETERRLLSVQCAAYYRGRYTGQVTPVMELHGLPALRLHFAPEPRRNLTH
jgi:hypothetical protein